MFQVKSSGTQEAIVVFNFLPATYVDPSWIEAPHPWRDQLARLRSPGAQFALSDWLLARYDLSACNDFEFASVEKLMFLQRPQELQRLAAVVGLLRHRNSLLRMIAGGTLARLGEEIGAATVERTLVDLPSADFLAAPETGIDRSVEYFLPQLIASGIPCLLAMLRPSWRAVHVRAQFKFPRDLLSQSPIVMEESEREAAIEYLKTYLLKERAL